MDNKPTYEELEKENLILKLDLELLHHTLSEYLQNLNKNVLGLLIGANTPFKLEKYFGHPTETLDWNNPNFKYYKNRYIKSIGSLDSE